MSEPSSFTALIHMTADAYARLMRAKTLDPLADEIAGVITDGLEDLVVFKYLKQDQEKAKINQQNPTAAEAVWRKGGGGGL